jgi:hypothetical protein
LSRSRTAGWSCPSLRLPSTAQCCLRVRRLPCKNVSVEGISWAPRLSPPLTPLRRRRPV